LSCSKQNVFLKCHVNAFVLLKLYQAGFFLCVSLTNRAG